MIDTAPTIVLKLPVNRVGRDYVVGDVGGDFDGLRVVLQRAGFNASVDRLFSVGHLITHEGSYSDCMRFLNQPGVYALRTNAEQELIELFESDEVEETFLVDLKRVAHPCACWLEGAGAAAWLEVRDAMLQLPIAITIGDWEPVFGLVHGGLPPGVDWPTFVRGLEFGDVSCCESALYQVAPPTWTDVKGVAGVYVSFSLSHSATEKLSNVVGVGPGPELRLLQRVPVCIP